MSKGPIVTGVVAIAAMSAVVGAFLSNANPYVESIAEAKLSHDDHLHLAGDIVKNSVERDPSSGKLRFVLRDAQGKQIAVVHSGEPPANINDATKVVAIGGIRHDVFYSEKLLVKCPSKYEGQSLTKS